MTLLTAARMLLGTPFVHGGRIVPCGRNPGGLDCIGFVAEACRVAGACDSRGAPIALSVPAHYARVPVGDALQQAMNSYITPLPPSEAQTGDIGLFRIRRHPQHVALLDSSGKDMRMLHAYQGAGKAAEHRMEPWWSQRLLAVYRPIYQAPC